MTDETENNPLLCEWCGDEIAPHDNVTGPDDAPYHESCHDRTLVTCPGLETTFRRDNDDWGNGRSGYCVSCSDERDENGESDDFPILPYGASIERILPKLGTPLADKMYYGLELELSVSTDRYDAAHALLSILGDYARIKSDSSIEGGGMEVVTAPATLAYHQTWWKEHAKAWEGWCNKHRARSYNNDSCGIHVHASRAPLSQLQIGKMLVFSNNGTPEHVRFLTYIAQRGSNSWCQRYTKTYRSVRDGNDDTRYQALNLEPRHTVELRIFKGNTRPDRIVKNIEYMAALVRYCGRATVSAAKVGDYRRFVAWLKQPQQRKDFPALAAYVGEYVAAHKTEFEPAPIEDIQTIKPARVAL